MDSRFDRFRLRWSLVVLTLVASPFPLADLATAGQQTAGSIVGQIRDESGGVLPGVTVTATSPALQVPSVSDVTNEQGEYRLTPLPIGTYQVEYALSGFQSMRHEDVRLTVGFTARLDVVLKVGTLAESVTVSGVAPVVDVTSTAAGTQFTRETLELTPTSRNGVIGLLAQAPGVRTTFDVGGSSVNTGPQWRAFGMGGEPWSLLEGIVTGELSAGGAANYWDYTSIEEANVTTVGNSAETPTRGIMLIGIVKSGGNTFHGNAFMAVTDEKLEGSNIDDALAAQGIRSGNPIQKRYDLSGELGGRLVRDKLWFYGNVRRRRDTQEILGAFKPDGSPSINDQFAWYHTEKLNYQMSSANRLILFHQYNHKMDVSGASQFVAWESRTNRPTLLDFRKLEWQGVGGNSLVASVQYGFWGYRSIWWTSSEDPPARDIATLRVWGDWTSSGQRAYNRRHHTKGSVSLYKPDFFYGNHEFKTGFDYLAATQARRNLSKKYNYQLVFNNGVPFQLDTYNYPINPRAAANYLGTYVQDSWAIARRLTLNMGLRYAHDNGFVPASCREAADFAAAECFDKAQFVIFNSVAPRLHAAWDITGNGRTLLKGGWGRFDHMRQVSGEVDAVDPNVSTTTVWRWNDRNGNKLYDAGEVNLDPTGLDYVSKSGFEGVPNPNEKQPKVDEFSVSFERELIANFAGRVTGVYYRTMDNYRTLNIKRPYESYNIPVTRPDPGPDGRVGTADDGGSVTYYEFPVALAGRQNDVRTLTNDPKANQNYKSFEVATFKRLSNRWHLMVSYSMTKLNTPIIAGLVPSESSANTRAGDFTPNAEINTSDRNREWLGKVAGAYIFPWDVTVSGNFEHRSGIPWARQVLFTGGRTIPSIVLNVEPIGTRRLPNTNLLDLRGQKTFSVAGGHKLDVRVNLFNALNVNTVRGVTMRAGATFLRPTTIVSPRILEFSASYTF